MTVINNDNEDYDVEGGNDTIDKIFCLSIDEVKTYFNQPHMFSDNERLAMRGTKYARSVSNSGWNLDYVKGKSFWYSGNSPFWLRSPGSNQMSAACVLSMGHLYTGGEKTFPTSFGVRPALWIEYED